jgi:hypothetical protein
MQNRTAGILAMSALPLLLAFGTASGTGVESTKADDCVGDRITKEVDAALGRGEKKIVFEGQKLQSIKNSCVAETGTPLGIYQFMMKYTFEGR